MIVRLFGGKHLDLRGPKINSTKAKNELRERKKILEARFDIVLQVWRFGHPLINNLLNKNCWKITN